MRPFHLAFTVFNLQTTIDFYCRHLGCSVGRQTEGWVDLNFYGHQVSFHLRNLGENETNDLATTQVDGDIISVPHFGVILQKEAWQALHQHLQQQQVPFVLAPKIRFIGEAGEQGTFFIRDPSQNLLEFKYFNNDNAIFAI
jgi:uncharacterized protein